MGSFSIALTGLKADSTALDMIGNNLANLNTTAFKDQTTTFSDLFYQQVGSSGSGDALQQGLGTRVSGTTSDFSEGTLTTTDSATDMAIQGNGFFVTEDNGTQELTRAGDFQLDNRGNLTTADGASVMGYAAVNGQVATGGSLVALRLPIGETEAAQATSNFSLTGNLSSSAATGTNFSTPITMYDSLGTSHVATVSFTKTATDQWSYSITLPAGDETGSPAGNTGTLTFDSSGKLVSPSSNVSGISFPGMADGASDMSLNWHGKLGGAAVTATTVDPPKKELEAVTHPKPLDPMLINLADDGGHAYLRLGIVLAEEDEPGAKAKEEAKPVPGADAAVRDTMFDVLGRENSAALLAPNGKEALKAELLKAISQRNPELHVKEIYFTDFLVQR